MSELHVFIPIQVPGTTLILCGCELCHLERQEWTNSQPSMIEELVAADAEDS